MMEIAGNILLVVRAKDWRLSFVPFIIGCVYCWLWWFQIPLSIASLRLFILSFVTTFGFAALGYFINEFFDKKTDAKAGKINRLNVLPSVYQLFLLIGCLAITFIPWYWLPTDRTTILFIVAEISFFFIYSLPFPRFKNVPLISGFIDSGYAYVLPLLLSFHTYSLFVKSVHNEMIYFFAATVFFIGFRNITIHHVNDIFKDMRSNTRTLPQRIGVTATNSLILVLMVEEIFLFLLWSIILSVRHPVFGIWIFVFIAVIVLRYRIVVPNFQFDFVSIEPVRHLTDPIYQFVFPAFTLLLAISVDYKWGLLLPFHVALLLTKPIRQKAILIIYSKSVTAKYITMDAVRKLILIPVGVIANYSIYFGFLLIGVNLKKKKLSAMDFIRQKLNGKK